MLSFKSGSIVFNMDRCCQCGACLASCHHDAIWATIDTQGLTTISISSDKCTLCKECVRVCPAHRLPFLSPEEDIWSTVKAKGLAWHTDRKIRQEASSGGAARALLAGCLNEGKCEAIYTLMQRQDAPWAAGELIKKRLDVDRVASSMYLPIPVLENLRFSGKIGSMAIVGTTCQLLAASKLLKGRVDTLICIAILCKQQKHLGFTRFTGKRLGIARCTKYTQVKYRGQSWPGQVTINDRSLDWEQAAAVPFGKRLWRISGCRLCPNPFGYKADITLADPWSLEPDSTTGKTMVIAWTDIGRDLLKNTPQLQFEPSLGIADIKKSIDWVNMQRKSHLVKFHLGRKVPPMVAFCGYLDKLQTAVLEKGLESCRLNSFIYKIIAHLPDPLKLIPVRRNQK